MFGEYIAFLAWCGVPRNIFILIQGPKFVSDEEIERIKAKIEEDNRAIAALESKKYGEYQSNIYDVINRELARYTLLVNNDRVEGGSPSDLIADTVADSLIPRSTTITRYDSPSLNTINSELRSEVRIRHCTD